MGNTRKSAGGKKSFGRFLQDARTQAGLRQSDVASALGYKSAQFVSDWERDVSSPPGYVLRKLAEMYDLSMEEIYDSLVATRISRLKRELKEDLFGTA